jgi:hypothetical protein
LRVKSSAKSLILSLLISAAIGSDRRGNRTEDNPEGQSEAETPAPRQSEVMQPKSAEKAERRTDYEPQRIDGPLVASLPVFPD